MTATPRQATVLLPTNLVGCSDDCKTIETGWECPTWGSACRKICGNGLENAPEACDDGNQTPSDGCTSCTVDPGYKFKAWGQLWYPSSIERVAYLLVVMASWTQLWSMATLKHVMTLTQLLVMAAAQLAQLSLKPGHTLMRHDRSLLYRS